MNCILYITTAKDINNYEKQLNAYLGNPITIQEVFNLTTLSATQNYLPFYFYGNTNQTVNYLFAKDSANTLRIFIEGVTQRDNLDQLVSGVEYVLNNIKSFLNRNEIKFNQVSATIWSEDEEILRGEYQSFWVKFNSSIPDLPTGIYLTFLTILYSIIRPIFEGISTTVLKTIISALINLAIAILAVFLWLLVKACYKETNLTFKIK